MNVQFILISKQVNIMQLHACMRISEKMPRLHHNNYEITTAHKQAVLEKEKKNRNMLAQRK